MSFIPYGKQYIDEEDIEEVVKILKSDFLTTGPKISEFENELCKVTGAKYCIVVANGTAALHLASMCLLNKDNKVLTTPNSFLATSNSILYVGAKPIFVDINPDGNINLDLCEEYLKKDHEIKAIYAVHFSGNPVEQKKLKELKSKYNVKILEDCSHSLGAYQNVDNEIVIAGSCKYSDCSTLSFHPVKHITTGEGGAITTNDDDIYKKLIQLRSHGMTRNKSDFLNLEMAYEDGIIAPWYYEMQSLGFNYRITDFQCALGISQLKKLNRFIERRKEIIKIYNKNFENTLIRPLHNNSNSSCHLYIVLIDFISCGFTRTSLINTLSKKGIGTQVHYIPINKQPYYQSIGYGNELTLVMDKYYRMCLSLPLYPELTNNDLDFIISTLKQITKKGL